MYKKPFQITDNISNNAFSFEKRKNSSIFITSVKDGSLEGIEMGDKVVFEDFDENGKLRSCKGLKYFVRTQHPKTGKPIVIVDNHNHVFYFWYEALKNGLIKKGATLVHIDQHKDTREPTSHLPKTDADDLQKVFEYTNTVLNVGNYIPPAIHDGLIDKVVSITSENDLTNNNPEGGTTSSRLQGSVSIILNVDLDFWAPEMDYIDNDLKTRRTKELIEHADFITIATSPFFVEQDRAIRVLRGLMT